MSEVKALVRVINRRLGDDDKLKNLLPLSDESDFWEKIKSGTILVKFVELFSSSCLKSSELNFGELNKWQTQANVRTAAAAFKDAKCRNVVSESDIQESNKENILKAMWEVVEMNMIDDFLKKANKHVPHFEKLFVEKETMFALNKLGSGEIFKRWINYQLEWMEKEEWFIQEGDLGRVESFTDLEDGFYLYWFIRQTTRNVICKKELESSIKEQSSALERIQLIHKEMIELDPIFGDWVLPEDIANKNEKLMTLWLIELFKKYSSLDDITYFDKHYLTEILDFSTFGEGEEGEIKIWMKSLGYEPDFSTLADGIIVLKLLDRIKPGCVDWKKVQMNPKNKFAMVSNCDKAIEIATKVLGLKLVGFSGSNLHAADAGNAMKFLSGVFKAHQEYVLMQAGGGTIKVGENFLVEWANSRIENVEEIGNLRDPKLSDGTFLFDLMSMIYPRNLNPELFGEDVAQNINAAFTSAVNLGIPLFITPKDVMDINYKLLNPTFASMYLKDVKMNPWLYKEYSYPRGN